MYPFTLAGPQFLGFYAIFAAGVLGAYWYYVLPSPVLTGASRIRELTAEPYKIACLRGAAAETVRVAIVNLLDRGMLAAQGALLMATGPALGGHSILPLDRAILSRCKSPASAAAILSDPVVRTACADYERELQREGLLLNDAQRRANTNGLLLVMVLLAGIALARILMALYRGYTNVFFLIVLACVACGLAYRISRRRPSAGGTQALSSLKTLMQRLLRDQANRLVPGGATNDALLLAAVFGIQALPVLTFPFVQQVFPKPASSRADGSRSSSSCGSSCGGGGGSGGGCGGCGGD